METKQITIDILLNKIQLLKQSLLFYSNKENYLNVNGNSKIYNDYGHQARFALEQIKDINKNFFDKEVFLKKYKEIINDFLKGSISFEEYDKKIIELNKIIENNDQN